MVLNKIHSLVPRIKEVGQFLKQPILLTSILVTGCVLGIRELGWLQSLELRMFDQALQWQPATSLDSRLLVVEITEADIKRFQQWPLSDEIIAQALEILQQQKPKVIGLDLYRDVPHPPGHEALIKQLQANNVITIEEHDIVPPPPQVPADRIGFNDIVIDPDGIVRRNFLFTTLDDQKFFSFALRLSLRYLADHQITLKVEPTALHLGDAIFPSLTRTSGGYQTLDDRGYQVLLQYRSPDQLARRVSLSDLIDGQVNPNWVKNKVVLIGTTAPSLKDVFFTPFSSEEKAHPMMAGVLIHTQMVSQILDTVSGSRSLYRFWPDSVEGLWILTWAISGGLIFGWGHRFSTIFCATLLAVGTLWLIYITLLGQSIWIPIIAPGLAFLSTGVIVLGIIKLYSDIYDPLTKLPNRNLLIQQLQQIILHNRKHPDCQFAVLMLSLNDFHHINTSLGYQAGDRALLEITETLKTDLPPKACLARVGGVDFAVLLRNLKESEVAIQLANHWQSKLAQPYNIQQQHFIISPSIGIAFSQPAHRYHPENLLRDAQTAMYRARMQGKACYEVFATGMQEQVLTRVRMETDLLRAIQQQEFLTYYQPIVSLATGEIIGFEALIRWQHPERGMIAPGCFISLAEDTGLILPIGEWILREACQQTRVWQQEIPRKTPLIISVNLSARQFTQPHLLQRIKQVLEETGLPGRSLKIEITESTVMEDVESAIILLLQLKALDINISMDDFGTGYSSLSYLHRFPIDTLKIDRSFVSHMTEASNNAEIVRTIMMLGHTLGLDVIAEGVETEIHVEKLRELGCKYGQGYFFAKPLSCDDATALLKQSPQW